MNEQLLNNKFLYLNKNFKQKLFLKSDSSYCDYINFVCEDSKYYTNIDFIHSKLTYTDICNLSSNAILEVEDTLNNPYSDINSMVKLRDTTPNVLINVGIENYPMLERKGHLRENILTEHEALQKGYSVKGKHYHGLGIDLYLKVINSLDDPIAIYRYTSKSKFRTESDYIILTQIKDKSENNIMVPIEVNKKGQYNHIEIKTNKIKTVYAKSNLNYYNNMILSGEITEVYKKMR